MLEGGKIFLRGLKKEDTKWLYSCFSDFGLRKFLGAEVRTLMVSEHYEEKFIKQAATEKTKRVFVVCEKKTKKPLGLITLTKIDFYNGTATVGY